MKINIYSIILFSALTFFSCSNDDNDKALEPPLQNNCESGMGKMLYTECCAEGPIQARPGDIISVTYTSNFESSIYSWVVVGGSITLVEGENSPTAKFRIEKGFVSDTIIGYGATSDGVPACSADIVIDLY
ncbi:hypothetical protein [Aequorivita marina]|uniref:hypothetical protein n=1 Tax=Aequorivita marina TaxID=3073654 RepID=UPI002874007B|nr:hypothetical protein [Aequorivita sp. S2608]MDS1298231.1 hypothetical protein [Aequorivita sp. S2608]